MKKTTYAIITAVVTVFVLGLAVTVYVTETATPITRCEDRVRSEFPAEYDSIEAVCDSIVVTATIEE